MSNINIPLSIINLRTDKETALASQQIFINKNPDFQREYEAWDEKLITRFIETILIGRAMNPIWTILNPEDESEEILDGMHRITTALDFLNNKFKLNGKYLSQLDTTIYNKKKFDELSYDDRSKIRNYNFTFNQLDSSYRTDVNKRRDMYEVLNKSSRTLNDYEFNKVLYNPFYSIISNYKEPFNSLFFNKKDKRGEIETEIIDLLVLSSKEMPKSWSSVTDLRNKWYDYNLGETEESVNDYLNKNERIIIDKIEFIKKIILHLKNEKVFSSNKKTFNRDYLPYKFIVCRLAYKLENISKFNRYIEKILQKLKQNILERDEDIQEILNSKSRNAMFQKKLIKLIDDLIDEEYDENNLNNKRFFSKNDIEKKLIEQDGKCNICKEEKEKYEGDHIRRWSKGGDTNYDNLQVLCTYCHKKKSNDEVK